MEWHIFCDTRDCRGHLFMIRVHWDPPKWFFFFFIKIFLFLFRQGKGGREGEKHQCVVASHMPPTGDLACNPGTCPDRESNRDPLACTALNPLSHTSQGHWSAFYCFLSLPLFGLSFPVFLSFFKVTHSSFSKHCIPLCMFSLNMCWSPLFISVQRSSSFLFTVA